jgi:hypothetical protein
MQDAKTYWQYAQDCLKLARTQPENRATLLDMAKVWTDLATKAEAQEKKAPAKHKKDTK